MGIEGLVILLVVLIIVFGYWGNGRWYNQGATPGAAGPGGIIGLLVTILIAVIVIVLIFMVIGGGMHFHISSQ